MATNVARTDITETEARELTDRINSAAGELWHLLLEAHERAAWRALGYKSWKEYAETEFNISRQYSYRLLDQGRVIRAIADAAGTEVSPIGRHRMHGKSETIPGISEHEARDIKPHLEEVTTEIRERVEAGEPAAAVVNDVVRKARRQDGELTGGRPSAAPAATGSSSIPADEAGREVITNVRQSQPVRQGRSPVEDHIEVEARRQSAARAQEAAAELQLKDTIANLRAQLQQRDAVLNRVRRALGLPKEGDIVAAVEALVERAA